MQSDSIKWAGRIVSALAAIFFLFDGVTKVMMIPGVIEATLELGYQEGHVMGIGILLLACTAIYLIPPTEIFGAILLTAYMGGAVATHVRAGSGLFPIIFSVAFGLFLWVGLYLRNARLREIVPFQSRQGAVRPSNGQ